MSRSLDRRLARLGAERHGRFFLLWSRSRTDQPADLATAIEHGTLIEGDYVICAVWPHDADLPASRWVTFDFHAFRWDEQQALLEAGEPTQDELPGLCANDPLTVPFAGKQPRQMSDMELCFCLLGRTVAPRPGR
jgi:hypothetical protein